MVMETLYSAPCLNDEIFTYWDKWKKNSSFKAIGKEDRKKLEEIMKNLNELEKQTSPSNPDIQFSRIAEEYLSLASNLIHLKWQKKDPKTRVDINLKCDSLFNKIFFAFKTLTNLLRANIESFTESHLHSDLLLDLNDEFQKINILSKLFYEYSVALNNGGELET